MKKALLDQRLLSVDKLNVAFEYGNTYIRLDDKNTKNIHKWTIFIELKDKNNDIKKYIKKVTFGLDDSFGIVSKSVNFPPY
mmetsp:Transcript_7428/g.6768  ORF Transcript_7428/g.6768 Transcript_7428/m.6768 type:complete len:81 (-) Transcript_7428:35-277(-)